MSGDRPLDPPPRPLPAEELVFQQVSVEARARVAGALGLTALTLVMLGPCSCFTTVGIGGILGAGAAVAGMRARAEEPSPAGSAWAQAGIVAGAFAAICGVVGAIAFVGLMITQVLGVISIVEWVSSMV